jgi:hypothetical protein
MVVLLDTDQMILWAPSYACVDLFLYALVVLLDTYQMIL